MEDDYEYQKLIENKNEQSNRRKPSFPPKFFWGLLFFGILGLLYLYVNSEVCYDIFVDGKKINFTGVENFVPPFVSYNPRVWVDNDHKLISCAIPKSMSQLAINIMCMLYDNKNFEAKHYSLNDTWHNERDCILEEDFSTPSAKTENSNKTVRFAFVRDPFQRFVSFFLDKCVNMNICYDCGTDMRCVVKKLYEGLRNIEKLRHKNVPITRLEKHAAPISWFCGFKKNLPKWHLLMMGSDAEQRKSSILHLSNILKVQGVQSSIVDKIEKDAMAGETDHSTHKSAHRIEVERQIQEDPFVRDLLHKIYFFDYLVFPFNRSPLDPKYQTNFWTLS